MEVFSFGGMAPTSPNVNTSTFVSSEHPTVPTHGPEYATSWPIAGGMTPHQSNGAFGMKLDNKLPIMHGSFDLYAVELETFLRRIGVWDVMGDDAVMRGSISSTQFALTDNVARGAILHGIPTADAELIRHEASAPAMWTCFVNKQTKREYANYIFARQLLYANKCNLERCE